METNVATNDNRIVKKETRGKITVSRVYKSDYQTEGTITAELKQTIDTKSIYPTKTVTSNLQDNVFGLEDFGFENQEFDSQETRVAWIDVPVGSTVESVQAKVDALPDATLYRILSNHPTLSDRQVAGIKQGFTTKDIIANKHVVRYPLKHEKEGQVILDNAGKIQYRSVYFKATAMVDIDKRTEDPKDFYATPEVAKELEMVVAANVAEDGIN